MFILVIQMHRFNPFVLMSFKCELVPASGCVNIVFTSLSFSQPTAPQPK